MGVDMKEVVMEFQNVYKKFKKGEIHDSFRDLIPAFTKKLFSLKKDNGLQEREFWAINDVSFQVCKGEALGIIGPNGAGKSTILKLLSGILRPNKGQINVTGRLSSLIELGAGFHYDLTGRENIYLNGVILGMKKSEIDKKFDQIVEFSGISEFIDTPVKRYSSGMYARLGFAIAAHVEPDILLVDEVLSVGDYVFQRKCIDKIHEILRSGATVIFISHNMESVISLCSRAILLRKGEIIKEGNPNEVTSEYYDNVGSKWAPNLAEKKKAFIKSTIFEGANDFSKPLNPGISIKCRLLIECVENCKLSPGLFLTQNGTFIFDTTYGRLTGKILSLSAGDNIELVWNIELNLNGGNYNIGIHLEDADTINSHLYHEYFPKVASFSIVEDCRCVGKSYLKPSIQLNLKN
jgi:lipopolysaccharide transport system ATP-binding protein